MVRSRPRRALASMSCCAFTEAKVRAQIAQIIETDETLTPIAAGAVTDADIRAGCLVVAERTNLAEEQDAAVFKAALAAIHEAEQRLAPAR